MLNIYKTSENKLKELSLSNLERGSWIHMVNPTNEELKAVSETCMVPLDVLGAALDTEERSRLE